jgi:hypothetical protein
VRRIAEHSFKSIIPLSSAVWCTSSARAPVPTSCRSLGTNEQHVRILSEERPEDGREGQPDLALRLNLVDARQMKQALGARGFPPGRQG